MQADAAAGAGVAEGAAVADVVLLVVGDITVGDVGGTDEATGAELR